VYTQAVGDGLAYIIKARVQLLRDLGAAISPQSAWLLIQGIETLSLRIERHVQNAQEIAEWLENHDDIASVNYSGLPTSPWYAAANRYAPKGVGAVLSFELKGGVRPAASSSTRSSCSATSPTSATCARSSSTRHPRRTRS
jgi:O-acetylhomoserine (thiol)-lyase